MDRSRRSNKRPRSERRGRSFSREKKRGSYARHRHNNRRSRDRRDAGHDSRYASGRPRHHHQSHRTVSNNDNSRKGLKQHNLNKRNDRPRLAHTQGTHDKQTSKSDNHGASPQPPRSPVSHDAFWAHIMFVRYDDAVAKVQSMRLGTISQFPDIPEPTVQPPHDVAAETIVTPPPSTTDVAKPSREGIQFASVREDDERKLQQRQKQIDFGKNTVGYNKYITKVPKHKRPKRNPKYPNTPDIYDKVSKRQFDGRVKAWRRALHTWDT